MTSIIWTLGVAFLALLSQIQAQPVGGVDVETKQKTIDEFVGTLRQANLSNVDYELFQKVAQHNEVFRQFKTRWNATKELFAQNFVKQPKPVTSNVNSLLASMYLSIFKASRQLKMRSIYDFVISQATLEDKKSLNVKESELPPAEGVTAGSKQIIVHDVLKYLKKENLTKLNFKTFEEKAKSDKVIKQFASLWRSDKSSDGTQVIDFHAAVEGLPDGFAALTNSSSIMDVDNIILVLKDDNVPTTAEEPKTNDTSKIVGSSDKDSAVASESAANEPSEQSKWQWLQYFMLMTFRFQ